MKAWNELENDPNVSLYWTGDKRNPDSYWYLDHGVKIEKFKDGHFEINNVMFAGDFYVPLKKHQIEIFEDKGWLEGCYNVCIDTYLIRLFKINKLLISSPENEDLINRKNNVEKKIKRYQELIDNLVI
jgi:hypothetical protein